MLDENIEYNSSVLKIWKSADAVCFDVDSTVCQDEMIDELAAYLGVGEEIAKLTARTMDGNISFRESLELRLSIMEPSKKQFDEFLENHGIKLTEGIRGLVADLHRRRVHVYLVSGGFRELVLPIADLLRIPHDRVYANVLFFNSEGNYESFDRMQLTSDSGSEEKGKAAVCWMLKKRFDYTNLVMIGDGTTDMEASPPADLFIGFGGNQCREYVRKHARWFVKRFEVLKRCLQ